MEVILREHGREARPARRHRQGGRRLRAQLSAAAQARARGDGRQQAADRARAQGALDAREAKSGTAPKRWRSGSPQVECVIARRVGENDTLYGSVTSADIADALAAPGLRGRQAQDSARRADQAARRVRGAAQAAPRRHRAGEGEGRAAKSRLALRDPAREPRSFSPEVPIEVSEFATEFSTPVS